MTRPHSSKSNTTGNADALIHGVTVKFSAAELRRIDARSGLGISRSAIIRDAVFGRDLTVDPGLALARELILLIKKMQIATPPPSYGQLNELIEVLREFIAVSVRKT